MVFGQSQLISCTSITVPKDHQPFIHIHKILKTQDKQTTFFFFQPTRHYWPPKPPTQSKPATKAPTSLLIRPNKSTLQLREFNISTIKKKNLKSPKLQKPKNFQKEREPNEALRKTQKKQCSSISLALGRRFLSLEISGRRRRRKKEEEEEEVKASGNLGFVSFFFLRGGISRVLIRRDLWSVKRCFFFLLLKKNESYGIGPFEHAWRPRRADFAAHAVQALVRTRGSSSSSSYYSLSWFFLKIFWFFCLFDWFVFRCSRNGGSGLIR